MRSWADEFPKAVRKKHILNKKAGNPTKYRLAEQKKLDRRTGMDILIKQ